MPTSAVLRLKSGTAVKLTKAATQDVTVTANGVSKMRTDWSAYLADGEKAPPKGTTATLEITGREPIEVRVETMEKTGRYRRVVGTVR